MELSGQQHQLVRVKFEYGNFHHQGPLVRGFYQPSLDIKKESIRNSTINT